MNVGKIVFYMSNNILYFSEIVEEREKSFILKDLLFDKSEWYYHKSRIGAKKMK